MVHAQSYASYESENEVAVDYEQPKQDVGVQTAPNMNFLVQILGFVNGLLGTGVIWPHFKKATMYKTPNTKSYSYRLYNLR